MNRIQIGGGGKPARNHKILQEFTAEFICILLAEFIAGFVAEIQPVKVDVRKKVTGK